MKIKEICAELNVTPPGLYWLLDRHAYELVGHISRTPTGRWKIDDEAVEILRKIIRSSKRTIIEYEPRDDGIDWELGRLNEEIKKLNLIKEQGVILQIGIEDVLHDYRKKLDIEVVRALSSALRYFTEHTSEKAIRKQLKKLEKEALKREKTAREGRG